MVLKVWRVAENGSEEIGKVVALAGKLFGGSEVVALVVSVASPCCCATTLTGRPVLTGWSGRGASVVGMTVWIGRVLDCPISSGFLQVVSLL